MTKSREPPPQGPYLTLTIPEALSLPKPEAPEKQRYEHVVDLLEHRAKHQADVVAVGFSELEEDGQNKWACRTITYGQIPSLARSVASQLKASLNEASKRIAPVDPQLPPLQPTPVIAILCPSGYDFFVHAAAVWYCGFALLPIALGTTPEGVKNLCSKTGACAVLAHPKQRDVAEQTLALWGDDEQAPALINLVDTSRPASTSASSELAAPRITRHSTLIIFHSSGSTGLPKPIHHTHDFWTFSLSTAPGVTSAAYTTTPLYHGGMSDFFRSLQAGSSLFFHPITGAGLSTQAILAGCEAAAKTAGSREVAYFLTVPFILEMLSKESAGLNFLASKQLVSTGGAPLPQAVGDLLVHQHNVPLVSRLGSSECGFLMSSWRDFTTDKGWNWLWGQEKGPSGELLLDWQENEDNPGLFELVVTAGWPTKLIKNREDGGFSTEDLYVRREEDGRYQYATRVDDTLVLLNGKKFAAGLIEAKLRGYEGIDDAVVFGSNRAMVGAIVVPATMASAKNDKARHAFVQSLRPYLDEQVNASLPLHARLAPELIVVADEELAAEIPRSSKGTLQRGQAYRKLETLFDRVYGDYERGTLPGYPAREALDGRALREKLMQLANGVLPTAIKSYDDDLHRAGLDSIGATRLKAGINQNIEVKGAQDGRLQGNVVYECPTVEALARWIESGGGEKAADTQAEMLAIVEKYGNALPSYQDQAKADESQAKPLVILTGATGALGSQLLCQLAAASTTVLCLVRAQDDEEAERRVRRAISSRKLDCSNWSDVHSFAATLGDEETLGVTSPNRLDALLKDRPFTIIHAAWSVNFALSLRSFEADNVRSLSHLLAFALRKGANGFLFCSSIASVMASKGEGEGPTTLRETLSSDPGTAGTLGYSQSKWVGESLVARASKEAGLPRACIARIGQLCSDSTTGVWNETEAWPLMTRAGLRKDEVGSMPVLQKQPLDWLPVDVCARALLELAGPAGESEPPPPLVAHVCLPCDAVAAPMWEDWLGWLEAAGGQFERATLADWLKKVEAKGGQIRGRALLDIWRGLGSEGGPKIETAVARKSSAALRGAEAMDAELARKTLEHWKHVGFI